MENQYFYNIEDVVYVNDIVTEVVVSLNVVYTYFFELGKHEISGIITKTNFD